jgi:hypothetical protein
MRTGKSIRGAISYNENKVCQGVAELIMASHFSRDISEMGFSEKLLRFEKLNQLNQKTKTNTLHLSLNFSPEDNLDSEKLQLIAVDYMERIGFSDQPYLVYLHNDTAHPHIHIVTSTIRQNGKPIYLHNLAKRMSEPARIAMEEEYGLIKAKGRKQFDIGLEETNAPMSKIITRVILQYKFTSLDELNSILRQYNIKADRGHPNSSTYLNNGLLYCKIDDAGYKTGASVKASSIHGAFTLKGLSKKFEHNRLVKLTFRKPVQHKIITALNQSWKSDHFINNLKKENIGCSVQYEPDGNITAISFVDNNTKTVFSCEELGFSIEMLLKNFNTSLKQIKDIVKVKSKPTEPIATVQSKIEYLSVDLLKTLLPPNIHQPDVSPHFLKKKRKKKKN